MTGNREVCIPNIQVEHTPLLPDHCIDDMCYGRRGMVPLPLVGSPPPPAHSKHQMAVTMAGSISRTVILFCHGSTPPLQLQLILTKLGEAVTKEHFVYPVFFP